MSRGRSGSGAEVSVIHCHIKELYLNVCAKFHFN